MAESRACNKGPVPECDRHALTTAFLRYVDDELVDSKLYELGAYSALTQGQGVVLSGLALLWKLIVPLLGVAPSGRIHKVDVRQSFLDCLSERPRRIVFPKIPRNILAETISKQVDYVWKCWMASKYFLTYTFIAITVQCDAKRCYN